MATLIDGLRDQARERFGKLKLELLTTDDDGCDCDGYDCEWCNPEDECECGDYHCSECYPDGPEDCECHECLHERAENGDCYDSRHCDAETYGGCRACQIYLRNHHSEQRRYNDHCDLCAEYDDCACCCCDPCDELDCSTCHPSDCDCERCYFPCARCGENAVTEDKDLVWAHEWRAGDWHRIAVCLGCLPGTCSECERYHEGECPPRISDITLQGQLALEDAV